MVRTYIPTQEEINTLPVEKKCTCCYKVKPRSGFSITSRFNSSRRYFVLRPACMRCEALRKRNQVSRAAEEKIFSQIAPLSAAKKLIEQNPEAFALLIQRFRTQYIAILEEERQKMLSRRRSIKEAAIATRGLYKEETDVASSH